MDSFRDAVDNVQKKLLDVYRADSDRIISDTRGAVRASKDHIGRWLFELLQNCDDAEAQKVQIHFEGNSIYIADNGKGLHPDAVKSLSMMDHSNKTAGMIGRKGVGFKSVYQVAPYVQVLNAGDGGVEFNPEKARDWLQESNLPEDPLPYQWIPFHISWDDSVLLNSQLKEFSRFKTVIVLRQVTSEAIEAAKRNLKDWPPYSLLSFRHLRRIESSEVEIQLSPEDGTWLLNDCRKETPSEWQVRSYAERPTDELLVTLAQDDRNAIPEEGVNLLIAAPIENACVVPTDEYLPIHVFYPTEQQGPVRLLLHAEFLVKGDRTALVPLDGSPFNLWLADRLASRACEFVNEAFRRESPSSHIALLVPFDDRESHPVANALWKRITEKAKTYLRIADADAQLRLTVGDARLIAVTVRPDSARILLGSTSLRSQLVHEEYDEHLEARKALGELGCEKIRDAELLKTITQNAELSGSDTQWVWALWEWLAAWVAAKPYGEEHGSRIRQVKALPILPVAGNLQKPSDLSGQIVTWRSDADTKNLPEWMPLIFVDDWFRDRIQENTESQSAIKKLCKEMDLEEPKANVIQRAVARAIDDYWKGPHDDPGRFLDYVLEQDWHETSEPCLQRCPLRLLRPVDEQDWVEARVAYFGEDWESQTLADLYSGLDTVAWISKIEVGARKNKLRQVLEWLGVVAYPRVIEDNKYVEVRSLPADCVEWKKYLECTRDSSDRSVQRVTGVQRIDHLVVDQLDVRKAMLLIRMVAQFWTQYYHVLTKTGAYGKRRREKYDSSWHVMAKWWWEIRERLPIPRGDGGTTYIPLKNHWIPNKQTMKSIGDLLPIIDLEFLDEDKNVVREWLVNEVEVRTQIEQITQDEWKEVLLTRIPEKAPVARIVADEQLRRKVVKWYEACLETLSNQEGGARTAFASCPLLCCRGDSWEYVATKPRYLDDDNEFVKVFAQDIWLFQIRSDLRSAAREYFGVLSLSGSVEEQIDLGESRSPLSKELQIQLCRSLCFLYAARSSGNRQADEKLLGRLREIEVYIVPDLKANLLFGDVQHEVERRWHATEDKILLHTDHANVTALAQAIARFVGTKSEADFYENLFRCNDDQQRMEKLLSRGMSEAEVRSRLREFVGGDGEEGENSGSGAELDQGHGDITPTGTGPKPAATENKSTMDSHQTETRNGGQDSGEDSSIRRKENETGDNSQGASGGKRTPLKFKDANNCSYHEGKSTGGNSETGGGSGGHGGSGTGTSAPALTEEEKSELEAAGRRIAVRKLEAMGYSVEPMPFENPGFDLSARRNGEELRIEVKAHMGKATVVDVTFRQYREYLNKTGYAWELWNVENLAEDTAEATFTRYNEIPIDALDVRMLRVDLRACQSPS